MRIYPLTGWQKYLMAFDSDRDNHVGVLRCIAQKFAIVSKGSLNLRRLDRAFKDVCARHDITRSQFVMLGGRWKFRIADEHATGVVVRDYRDVSEQEVAPIIVEHACKLIPMDGSSLVQVELLRFGPHGDGLVLRVHHAIMDGYGILIFLEDLIKRMLGLPLLGVGLSHQAYLQGWGDNTTLRDAEIERYWAQKLLPVPKPLNIGRVKRDLPPLDGTVSWRQCRALPYTLDEVQAQKLAARADAENTSAFMLCNAAFLQVLAQAANADDVLYSVTLGRMDGPLSKYAGHHTLHPFMRCRGIVGQPVGDVARGVMQELSETLAHLPSPAARRAGCWDEKLKAEGGYPRQITTGANRANSRTGLSVFADGFLLEPGRWFKMGRFEFKKIALPLNAGDLDELTMRPNIGPHDGRVEFRYDTAAYEDDEITELAKATFAKLGIAPKPLPLLETPPPIWT